MEANEDLPLQDKIDEMISQAQSMQSSQTSFVVSEHRNKKGRRGGLEFKVQKVKQANRDVSIGKPNWEPESAVSAEKITAYWERKN